MYDRFVLVSTENNAKRWVVPFATLEVIEHPNIHVHLADVLVRELRCFQVDQDKAFQQIVVKHKVNVKMRCFAADPKLPSHEGKSLAQFE